METKKGTKNIQIVIIVLLILIILGLIGYIYYEKEIMPKEEKEVSNKLTTNDKDSETESAEEKPIDFKKCLNCSDTDIYYNITSEEHIEEVNASYSSENNTIGIMNINTNSYNQKAGSNYTVPSELYEYNFDKAIKEVLVYNIGQEELYPFVMYLMEDGTINYIDIYAGLEKNDLSSYKTIPKLKKITKLYSASAGKEQGIHTILAKQADGSYYDLSNLKLNS